MTNILDSLKSKLKKTLDEATGGSLSDNKGWVRQGQFTPKEQLQRIGSDLSYQARDTFSNGLQKAWDNGGILNKAVTGIQSGVNNVANWKRFELPKPQIQNPIGKTALNLAYAIPEGLANIPRNYLTGIARTSQELGTAVKDRRQVNWQNLAGGVAPLAESLIDVGTMGFLTPTKSVFKEGTKQSIKLAIKNGALKGSGMGALGGLTYGVDNQYGKKFNTGEVAQDVVGGALLGGTVGGAIGGAGGVKNKLFNGYKNIGADEKTANELTKQHFIGQKTDRVIKFNKDQKRVYERINKELGRPLDKPVLQSDLKRYMNKTNGIPDSEINIGLSVRKVDSKNPIRLRKVSNPSEIVNPTVSSEAMQAKNITKAGGSTPLEELKLKLAQKQPGALPSSEVPTSPSPLSQTGQTPRTGVSQLEQPFDNIISEAKKNIGRIAEEKPKTLSQTASDTYSQWVDRYNPITKDTDIVKKQLKLKGAELRPEFDPTYQVRRLTGAGGIADYRFKSELEPIIKEMDSLKIDKADMDVYLANKRMAGFGKAGREVYGADPVKSQQVVGAIEAKYGENVKLIADKLYKYQDEGFDQMVKAGFLSPESAKVIKGQNPDYAPLQRVMDEVDNYLGVPTRKAMQGSQPVLKLKGSTRQIESPVENIIANTFKQRAAIEKNNVAKTIAGLQNIADLGYKKVSKSGNDTITVWNNGQKEYWQVGDGIANVAKGLNEENMNTLLKIFTAPASLLRQGATGRNPEFIIPNIIRDQFDAGITSKYGYIPFIDYVSGLKSMINNDDIFQKWQSSGAKIDLGEMAGRKNISAYFNEKTAKKGLFDWLGSAMDVMGKYSEVPTRVGLFKKALQKTGNETLAMMESRDATVDFARMGSKMKVANSIVPFLNVGIQGFDKLIRAVKDHPGKVLLNATAYGALPAITTTLYNLTNYPKEYSEIPQFEKDANFVLVKGRNESGTVDYITIPKGNVLPVVTNPIQSFIEYVAGTSQQTLGQFATQFISSTLPVVGDGQSLKEVAVKTVGSNLPQMIKPVTENLINKSFYKYDPKKEDTKEIVPYYLKKEEPYKQSYEFTPSMYKGIGAVLNVSPLQVQNLMEGYLAGYSKIPAQMIEIAKNISEGKDVETNQKTILRRFIKETYPTKEKTNDTTPQQTTPLMERITGKVKAAEDAPANKDNTTFWSRITGNKKTTEVTDKIITYKKGDKEYKLDLGKEFKAPNFSSEDPFDKEAVSRYKSELSSQINKIYDAYSDGKMGENQARIEVKNLQDLYDQTKKPKTQKAKKIKVGKATKLKSIQVKKSPKMQSSKISLSTPKLSINTTSGKKTAKLKIKTLPKTKLKINKLKV